MTWFFLILIGWFLIRCLQSAPSQPSLQVIVHIHAAQILVQRKIS